MISPILSLPVPFPHDNDGLDKWRQVINEAYSFEVDLNHNTLKFRGDVYDLESFLSLADIVREERRIYNEEFSGRYPKTMG